MESHPKQHEHQQMHWAAGQPKEMPGCFWLKLIVPLRTVFTASFCNINMHGAYGNTYEL
jgi:hypothetical protein